jgi:hypothetical protein
VRFSLFEEPAPLPELIRNAVWVTASKSDRIFRLVAGPSRALRSWIVE